MEDALQQRYVDNLSLAAVQGHHGGECPDESRDFVGECEGREHRFAPGLTADGGDTPHRFGDGGKPRP